MRGIDRERWRTLEPLLDEVLDLAPRERAQWLEALRTSSPDVAAELSVLLSGEEDLDRAGFLEPPSIASLAGLELGPWTLERPLGRGGMGNVWLARRSDGRFEGTAAVKLLNLALVNEAGQARFRREGSALARLAHPGIARLLDAGVSPGAQPYLVLEHVDGRPIDQYADEQRLTAEARARLFMQVLEAVGHAHSNLIVHRDLKPSNILVTPDGRVKLLDFGIAKLLDGAPDGATTGEIDNDAAVRPASLTADGGRALTPEYAAPEQASGGAISTAVDIYAAGVLLYVLLSHRHPTAEGCRTPMEFLAALQDREPAQLGLGDLDSVLARALRKDPADRYRTAAEFANDLAHWLRHEPVTARPQSLGYRARKFVRRHRAVVAAAVAGFVLSGIYVSTVARDRARLRAALAEAETNAQRAEQVTDFAVGLFEATEGGPAYADSLSARELLSRAAYRARELTGQPVIQAQMLDLIGRIRGELGDYDSARTVLAEALAIRRRVLGNDHPDVATTMLDLAAAIRRREDVGAMMVELPREALALRRRRYGDLDPRTADAMYALASALHESGDFAGARRLFDQWLTAVRAQPPQLTPRRAEQLASLSDVMLFSGHPEEAVSLARQAVSIVTALYGPDHSRVGVQLNGLASALDEAGDRVRADSVHRAAVAVLRKAYPRGHRSLANALRDFGQHLRPPHMDEAEQALRDAAEIFRRGSGSGFDYAAVLIQLGRVLSTEGRYAQAESTLRATLAMKELSAPGPVRVRASVFLGEALRGQGRLAEAEPLLLEGYRAAIRSKVLSHDGWYAARSLAKLYEAQGRMDEAAFYRAVDTRGR